MEITTNSAAKTLPPPAQVEVDVATRARRERLLGVLAVTGAMATVYGFSPQAVQWVLAEHHWVGLLGLAALLTASAQWYQAWRRSRTRGPPLIAAAFVTLDPLKPSAHGSGSAVAEDVRRILADWYFGATCWSYLHYLFTSLAFAGPIVATVLAQRGMDGVPFAMAASSLGAAGLASVDARQKSNRLREAWRLLRAAYMEYCIAGHGAGDAKPLVDACVRADRLIGNEVGVPPKEGSPPERRRRISRIIRGTTTSGTPPKSGATPAASP